MKKGFTLIELLVVVLIIGILSAIALPQYTRAVWKARMAEPVMRMRAFEQALQEYYLETGGVIPGETDVYMEDRNSDIVAGLTKTANHKYSSKHFVYDTPNVTNDAGGIIWDLGTISSPELSLTLYGASTDGGRTYVKYCYYSHAGGGQVLEKFLCEGLQGFVPTDVLP